MCRLSSPLFLLVFFFFQYLVIEWCAPLERTLSLRQRQQNSKNRERLFCGLLLLVLRGDERGEGRDNKKQYGYSRGSLDRNKEKRTDGRTGDIMSTPSHSMHVQKEMRDLFGVRVGGSETKLAVRAIKVHIVRSVCVCARDDTSTGQTHEIKPTITKARRQTPTLGAQDKQHANHAMLHTHLPRTHTLSLSRTQNVPHERITQHKPLRAGLAVLQHHNPVLTLIVTLL